MGNPAKYLTEGPAVCCCVHVFAILGGRAGQVSPDSPFSRYQLIPRASIFSRWPFGDGRTPARLFGKHFQQIFRSPSQCACHCPPYFGLFFFYFSFERRRRRSETFSFFVFVCVRVCVCVLRERERSDLFQKAGA